MNIFLAKANHWMWLFWAILLAYTGYVFINYLGPFYLFVSILCLIKAIMGYTHRSFDQKFPWPVFGALVTFLLLVAIFCILEGSGKAGGGGFAL